MVDLGVFVTIVGAEPGVLKTYVGMVSILNKEAVSDKKMGVGRRKERHHGCIPFGIVRFVGIMTTCLGGLGGPFFIKPCSNM
jgi:hypothetical protein